MIIKFLKFMVLNKTVKNNSFVITAVLCHGHMIRTF